MDSQKNGVVERVPDGWACIELHDGQRVSGYLSQVEFAGIPHAKIQVTKADGSVVATAYFQGRLVSSILSISEGLAKDFGDIFTPIDLRKISGSGAVKRGGKR